MSSICISEIFKTSVKLRFFFFIVLRIVEFTKFMFQSKKLLLNYSIKAFLYKIYSTKRTKYLNILGKKNRGSAPSHWGRASSSIARKAVQALEKMKLVEKDANGGRKLTGQGRRDLDRIAAQLRKDSWPKKVAAPAVISTA